MRFDRSFRRTRAGRLGLGLAMAAFVGSLAACDDVLDVELPGQIDEPALFQPPQAGIIVNSAIASIECAYSEFIASTAAGYEDVMLRVTGWWGGAHEFEIAPGTANCNTGETGRGWWSPFQAGRWLAEQAHQHISGWSADQIPGNKEQLLAQSAIYAGIVYNVMGEYFCELTVDEGPLLSWEETLVRGEEWFTTALEHIANAGGDFAVPHGISTSARQMALLLRARSRFARGDLTGAAADAGQISIGFKAYASRDGGGERTRWNRVFNAHNGSGWGSVMGPVDWWTGPGNWPDVIPFTGYHHLGVLPDGRAVTDTGHPITTEDFAQAVPDSRVTVTYEGIYNDFPAWRQHKYPGLNSYMPIANWEEAYLILAEIEGGQSAINRVNAIRSFHELPPVTYVDPGNAQQIEYMIIEERRRSLFLEARFWTTKLQKDLWFPRGFGATPYPYAYLSGVRMVMPAAEFDLNPNLDESMRGMHCPAGQSPL